MSCRVEFGLRLAFHQNQAQHERNSMRMLIGATNLAFCEPIFRHALSTIAYYAMVLARASNLTAWFLLDRCHCGALVRLFITCALRNRGPCWWCYLCARLQAFERQSTIAIRELACSSAIVASDLGVLIGSIVGLYIQACIYARQGIDGASALGVFCE